MREKAVMKAQGLPMRVLLSELTSPGLASMLSEKSVFQPAGNPREFRNLSREVVEAGVSVTRHQVHRVCLKSGALDLRHHAAE
jgi:hypothetical protein